MTCCTKTSTQGRVGILTEVREREMDMASKCSCLKSLNFKIYRAEDALEAMVEDALMVDGVGMAVLCECKDLCRNKFI